MLPIIFLLTIIALCLLKLAYGKPNAAAPAPDWQPPKLHTWKPYQWNTTPVEEPKEDPYFGPEPTPEQRAEQQQFIFNHLYHNPDPFSKLREHFPHLARQAEALRQYEALEGLYKANLIDEITYQIELKKITDMVSIEGDF